MPPSGNQNQLSFDYRKAKRSGPADGLVSQTRLQRSQHWSQLTVQVFDEPAYAAPIVLAPPQQIRLILMLSGALRIGLTVGKKSSVLTSGPGTVKLTSGSHLPYQMHWSPLSAEPVKTTHLYLPTTLLATTGEKMGLNPARIELREGPNRADPLLYQLGKTLGSELENPSIQSELYADIALQMVAAQLLQHHCSFTHRLPDNRGTLSAPLLGKLRDFVRTHISERIRLDTLAELAHMSPYHFCRVFKRSTGLSPNQFVIQQRLAVAVDLLQHTTLQINEVASAVGYQSHAHFTQLFVNHTGRLPLEYRLARRHYRIG